MTHVLACSCSYASERFGREHAASPLLLAAGAPAATIDPAIYTAPALRSVSFAQLSQMQVDWVWHGIEKLE